MSQPETVFIGQCDEDYAYYSIGVSDLKILKTISARFSILHPQRFNMQTFKDGVWDGRVNFLKNNRLLKGLIWILIDFCRENKIKIVNDIPLLQKTDEIQLEKWIKTNIKLVNTPHDFQLQCVLDMVKYMSISAFSVTGSGKSFIIYIFSMMMLRKNIKTIIIVPNLNLLYQMYADLMEASCNELKPYVQMMSSKQKEKDFVSPIVLITWQSGSKKKMKDLKQFGCVIGDEMHLSSATKYQTLVRNINSKYKLGLTGTEPPDTDPNYYTVVGNFGKPIVYSSYKDLQDRKIISEFNIYVKILQYTEEEKIDFWNNYVDYREEYYYLSKVIKRNEYISSITDEMDGNTLIITTFIQNEASNIKDFFINKYGDTRPIYYIDGGVKAVDRERIRKELNNFNNAILIASVATLAVGVNIKNLKNLIIPTSIATDARLRQVIGRILRLKQDGNQARVFDIVDNMCYRMEGEVRRVNTSAKQYMKRLKIYKKFNFTVIEEKVTI